MERLKYSLSKIKWGSLAHTLQNLVLPVLILVLVNMDLSEFALGLIIISKWRIFAVAPYHWLSNLRAGSADLIVGLCAVFLMVGVADLTSTTLAAVIIQSVIAALYIFWLIALKPGTSKFLTSAQAFIAQSVGFLTLFWFANEIPEILLVFLAWAIATASATHFFSAHEDQFSGVLAITWGFFVAQLSWIMNRWLVGYEIAGSFRISNIVILLVAISYGVGLIYTLWVEDKLSLGRLRQYLAFMTAIVVAIVGLTNWSGSV